MIPAQRANLLAPPDTAAILASFRAGTFGEAQLATLLANYASVQSLVPVWLPIESAPTVSATYEGGDPVLVATALGPKMIGVVRQFEGADGKVRIGVGAGMGIYKATHWMPLPNAPDGS